MLKFALEIGVFHFHLCCKEDASKLNYLLAVSLKCFQDLVKQYPSQSESYLEILLFLPSLVCKSYELRGYHTIARMDFCG